MTCLLGGNAIVYCASTSEGTLKLKRKKNILSRPHIFGSEAVSFFTPESQKIIIICHNDVLSGFHDQKWQPTRASGPHEFQHRRVLLQYLDYQGDRIQMSRIITIRLSGTRRLSLQRGRKRSRE